jgi:CRISPR-associated protein Cst2
VVGIPDKTHTEQYFHVKYDPESRGKSAGQADKGEGTVAGKQAIFHRPASSGIYALICHLELDRIGRNDITRELVISEESRKTRGRALLQALMATLVKPAGAQRNTQNPHILGCSGIAAWSRSHFPAPLVSPLTDAYQGEMESVAATINRSGGETISTERFQSLGQGVELLSKVAELL